MRSVFYLLFLIWLVAPIYAFAANARVCESAFSNNANLQHITLLGSRYHDEFLKEEDSSFEHARVLKQRFGNTFVYKGEVDEIMLENRNAGTEFQIVRNSRGRGSGENLVDGRIAIVEQARVGVKTIHQSYGNRLSQNEKDLIEKLEDRFSTNDQWAHDPSISNYSDYAGESNAIGFAVVRDASQKLIGFLRIIDGSRISIPAEKILEVKKIKTEYFDEMRSQGYELIEIGKYYIDANLGPLDLKNTRAALFTWFSKTYLEHANPKRIFIIDVGSAIHERAYRNLFGTKRVDRQVFYPQLSPQDNILYVDQRTLSAHISSVLAELKISE